MSVPMNCLGQPAQMPTVALNLVLSETRVYSGECLSATVLLDSADPDNAIQEFLAEISGVGQTGWVNIHTDKIYETEQAYLNIVVPLCQQPMELSPGRHKFGLRVTIPDSVPSSFESQFGSIRYSIKVQLIGNAEHCSAVEVFPFLVLAKSYFDDIPHAIIHFDYQDEIDFTVCTLPFGTVRLQISLPRTVFCIGEVIRAHLHVRNGTRKTLKDCRLQLVLKTQFEARSRYEQASDRKVVENVMDSYPLGRVKGRTDLDMEECMLRVPEQAVPTHQGSPDSIIVLSYVLRFNALPGIETEIPVVVTSLGYRQIVAEPARPERNGQAMKGGGRERGARRL
uniref:Arrestin C-terminal-like domain-containing protein n=1 Tax=Globodera rostochiensis TaxID=31243 RepID=A0A914HSG5_GLORO